MEFNSGFKGLIKLQYSRQSFEKYSKFNFMQIRPVERTEAYNGYLYANHHHHHHHISVMELGHLLTRSGLMYPEVSSKVCQDSFFQLGNSVSLPWVIYYGAFYLHVVSSFSCIPVICLKLGLFLIPLQFVHLFCNQSNCLHKFIEPHRNYFYVKHI